MENPYFVMLYFQKGEGATPMVDEDDKVMFFPTYATAASVAMNNFMGRHFGWEVFELGDGTSQ